MPNHLVRLSTHARREISVGMARQRRELSEEIARQLRSQPERQPGLLYPQPRPNLRALTKPPPSEPVHHTQRSAGVAASAGAAVVPPPPLEPADSDDEEAAPLSKRRKAQLPSHTPVVPPSMRMGVASRPSSLSTTAVVTAASASAATIDTVEDAIFRSYSTREAATRDAIDGSSAFSAAKPRSSVQSTCSGDLTLGGLTSSADAKM